MKIQMPNSHLSEILLEEMLGISRNEDKITRIFYWQLVLSVSYVAYARKLMEGWLFLPLDRVFGVHLLKTLRPCTTLENSHVSFLFTILKKAASTIARKQLRKLVLSTHEDINCESEALEIYEFKIGYENHVNEDSLSEDIIAENVHVFLQDLRREMDKLKFGDAPYKKDALSDVPAGLLAALITRTGNVSIRLPGEIQRSKVGLPTIREPQSLKIGEVHVGPFSLIVTIHFKITPLSFITPVPEELQDSEANWETIKSLPGRVSWKNEDFFSSEDFKVIKAKASQITNHEIHCPCNQKNTNGTIQCHCCGYWQHSSCFGIYRKKEVPQYHVCLECSQKYHLICTDCLLLLREESELQDLCRYRKILVNIIHYMYRPDPVVPIPHITIRVQHLKESINDSDSVVADWLVERLLCSQVLKPTERNGDEFVWVDMNRLEEVFQLQMGKQICYKVLEQESQGK